MAKIKFLKLGEKSAGFYDPGSGISVSGKMVIQVTNRETKYPRVSKALLGSHLVLASEEEFNDWREFEGSTRKDIQATTASKNSMLEAKVKKLEAENAKLKESKEAPSDESPFDNMNSKALAKYYKANYDLSEAEVDDFEEMDIGNKRTFLKEQEAAQ